MTRILVADIKRAVARRYHVPLAVMSEPDGANGSRKRRHAWPRQVAMTLATRLTEHSYVRIGHFFGGRDHSTVISSCRAVNARAAKNQRLRNSMRRITLELIRTDGGYA